LIGTVIPALGTMNQNDIFLSSIAGPNIEWEKTFGGDEFDWFYCVQQTNDGGYIVLGGSEELDMNNAWLMKLNPDGNEEWGSINYDINGGSNIKKILPFIIIILFISSFSQISLAENQIKNIKYINNSNQINELTWAIMRYQGDITNPPCNFGTIEMPKPTPGSIVIPINMMCYETCHAAVSIFNDDKMDTVEALDEYDIKNMIFRLSFMLISEWARPKSLPCYYPTSFADEMLSLGEVCLRANLVGHCYSQSLFNTAVLRLCGFSAEEVFTLTMPIHAVTIFKADGKWYIFDSTPAEFARRGMLDSLIFDSMDPPLDDIIIYLENDKYFINFGAGSPTYKPYLEQPFSNMEAELLKTIISDITPLFNNSQLGYPGWNLTDFLNIAVPCPEVKTIAVPYNVDNAVGDTIEEKTQSLISLNKEFMKNQIGGDILNQYDRSFYGIGDLKVDYPQTYANAAKYAIITSWIASKLDRTSQILDCILTSYWIKLNVKNKPIMEYNHVAQSDLLYLRHAGSTLDQAILAYGTLRNMKKDINLWQPEDLYIIATEDYEGFLAINLTGDWRYLNFGKGKSLQNDPPTNSIISFNEIECLGIWKE